MDRSVVNSTPLSWAINVGFALVPVFLVLGVLLGVVAHAWTRWRLSP